MVKVTASRRDFIFFILLILLIKVAHNGRVAQRDAVIYAPAAQSEDAAVSLPAQNLIHEPDERIVKKLYELIEQAEMLIEKLESAHEKYAYVQEMHERLLNLQAKYEHTSPAIALLGPLGATGLVIQEQAIEKELADINRSFNTILN